MKITRTDNIITLDCTGDKPLCDALMFSIVKTTKKLERKLGTKVLE